MSRLFIGIFIIHNCEFLIPKDDFPDKGAEVGFDFFEDLGFVAEEFEFQGSVLDAYVKDAVAEILAFRELRAHRPDVLRPTFEEHLLVHQMLLPRLAHKPANQLF